jgi:hypothetical protein
MTLKPCPACHDPNPIHYKGGEYGRCANEKCQLEGPKGDPDGAKWNALPRIDQRWCDTCTHENPKGVSDPCLSCKNEAPLLRYMSNWEGKS